MNISSISFGSTYEVKSKDNSFDKLLTVYSINKKFKNVKIYKSEEFSHNLKYNYESQLNVAADDKFDSDIESYLIQNNINFRKKTNDDLMSKGSILKRIRIPNYKYATPIYIPNTVYLQADLFENLFKDSGQYVEQYDKLGRISKEKYDEAIECIKSDMPIDAPEVYLKNNDGIPEVGFKEGRYLYSVMRDLGFDSIPLAMTEESYKTAIKMKLVDKTERLN